MSKIIDYEVRNAARIEINYIKSGWIPYGNPFVDNRNSDRQAFVKYKYGFLRRFLKWLFDFVW